MQQVETSAYKRCYSINSWSETSFRNLLLGKCSTVACRARFSTFQQSLIFQGRLVTLNEKITIREFISRVKKHLGMANVRLGLAVGATQDTLIQSVAMCAGSGWGEYINCEEN